MPPPTSSSTQSSVSNKSNFTLHKVTPADIPALTSPTSLSIRSLNKSLHTDGTHFVFTLQESPELIVACGWWSFRKTLYGGDLAPGQKPARRDLLTERASIRAIFTHPDWARQGLGTMMMRHWFLRLEMGSTLTGVALYERCGYRKSGREEAVKLPNGAGLRVVHMVKDLPEE
ncbi:acyl-CoA N-acyltransferase [Cenococcum geophilum]